MQRNEHAAQTIRSNYLNEVDIITNVPVMTIIVVTLC